MEKLITLARRLSVGIAALCFLMDAGATCSYPIDNAPRVPMQDRITPDVIARLSGDWYEDFVETARFNGKRMGASQAVIEREVANARLEVEGSPARVWITVMPNGDFRRGGNSTLKKIQPREWVIYIPVSEGCAQIYSIDGKFYRGSHEHFYVRLVNQPP